MISAARAVIEAGEATALTMGHDQIASCISQPPGKPDRTVFRPGGKPAPAETRHADVADIVVLRTAARTIKRKTSPALRLKTF